MNSPRIATSWSSVPSVVYDGDEAISVRVLEKQHVDMKYKLSQIQKIADHCQKLIEKYDIEMSKFVDEMSDCETEAALERTMVLWKNSRRCRDEARFKRNVLLGVL